MTTISKLQKNKSFAEAYGLPIIACIDMGTNSFHMIVCQASNKHDHFEIITRVREAVPFFRKALSAHTIDSSALSQATKILKDMKEKAIQKGARQIIAVATSAVRESDNGEQALISIRKELGIDARMISGREEARLIYLGVLWSMPALKERFSIIDIGGGSTEIIIADRHRSYFSESYKTGAARLTQRFFKKEKPTPQEIRELHDEIRGMIRPTATRINEIGGFNTLIGTSGTIQTIAKLDRISKKIEHSESHGYILKLANLESIVTYLENAALSGERVKDISTDRNRTILAGAIVLLETMRSLGVSQLTVCGAALREGVIVDTLLQTGWLEADFTEHLNPRTKSVYRLLEKYQASIPHAKQVAALAVQIFEKSKANKLHNHNTSITRLLWAAGMLHDVGMFIGRNGHHKHSYYLIRHGELLGHSEEEAEVIANIARYHRGSDPKESHEAYTQLAPETRRLVTDMAAILRIAEALDRSHQQVVKKIDLDLKPSNKGKDNPVLSLIIYVNHGESWEAETWALKEKKALFEKQFQVTLAIEMRVNHGTGKASDK